MRWHWLGPITIALTSSFAAAQETSSFASAVQTLLAERAARMEVVDRLIERDALRRVYQSPDPRPLWSTLDTGPTRQALATIAILAASDTRGLPHANYAVADLRALASLAGNSRADAARFDVALSESTIRFLADLHVGRVDPRTVQFDLPNVTDRVDLAELVTNVARAADVAAAVAQAEPPYAGYRDLERALARYRRLAADTTLRVPRPTTKTIRPGDRYADVPTLARLLRALGDLDAAAADTNPYAPNDSTPVPLYGGALVDGMVRFQRRHGLAPDSAIGRATMAQLRVPLARRVRQIELTLERWRWLPDKAPSRYVVVNIPGFQLYVFENDSTTQRPLLTMNVIVGQAEGRHDTPVFTGTMREVVFRPYWDVPPRIARTELIPTFRRRPEYFADEGFEIVRRGTSDVGAAKTFPPTAQSFARVVAGELRIRQRPGASNALGLVKFVFPNPYNVYLHGTPMPELFAHSRRDFSHGCIRIEEPPDLAELVLRGQSPWNREAIDSAMHGTRTVHVPIARPLAVFVVYATAVADDAGVVSFYPDLYGHDAVLERALGLPPISTPQSTAPAR